MTTTIDMGPLLGDPPITLSVAALLFPGSRGASHAAKQTLLRRIRRGNMIGGRRVHLGAIRIGGSWYTSVAAIAAYVAACNETTAPSLPQSSAESRRASRKAEAQLIRLGC